MFDLPIFLFNYFYQTFCSVSRFCIKLFGCRSPASAIVAPFNYKPSPAAAAVKRNTSYVSSIGRRREEELTASEEEEEKKFQQTSSAMVTLV